MLAQLARDNERIVPIAFHVDYFNDPWKDPFSDKRFSQREYQYSLIYQRDQKAKGANELYFTPMLMIDGRSPMLGTDKAEARKALAKALAAKPGVLIDLALEDKGESGKKSLKVTLHEPRSEVAGKEVLVGVATFEEPVSTKVPSGENAGKTLVEHFAVRALTVETATPERGKPTTLTVPVALEAGWDAKKCGLAVFIQDEESGRIHQAATIPWEGAARR